MRDVTAHAARAVFLPELTQIPDVSNTVWDWLAGNEQCPISTLNALHQNGAELFSNGDPSADINACHALARVMGATNSSHFLPGSKGFYA
jgi:hypothetical protein